MNCMILANICSHVQYILIPSHHLKVSTESMLSVYSMGAEGNNYCKFPITGDVYLSMNYDYRLPSYNNHAAYPRIHR